MKAVRKSIIATSLLALPGLACALGLGGIDVKSGLNEPLVAEIPVIVGAADERSGLSVSLARPEDFANVGLDYSRVTAELQFAVTTNARGDTVIRVTSTDAVREPFLSLLLEVNWSKGRLLREYSVLLDPPVMASARRGSGVTAQPVAEPVAATSEPIASAVEPVASQPEPAAEPAPAVTAAAPEAVPEPQPEAAPEPVAAEPPPAAQPVAPAAAAGEYGPVATGDTLYVIAQRTRPDASVSIDQMMVSILRANSQAFYQDNINALKTGAILRIPTGAEVVSAAEAQAAVQEHNQLWTSYQSRASANPALVSDAGASSVAAESTPSTYSSDRIELVAPRSGDAQGSADRPDGQADAASAAQVEKVRAELALVKEDLTSAQRESGDLRSRVSELERLKGDQERLIGLKDDQIAELQRKLEELQKAAASAPVASTADPAPVIETPPETPSDPIPDQPVASTDPTTTTDPAASTSDPATPISKEDIWGAAVDEPATTDPTASTDPATTDPTASTDPATTDPTASTDPATTDPTASTDPATTDPATLTGSDTTTPDTTTTPIADPVPATPVAVEPAAEAPGFLGEYGLWLAGGAGLLLLLGLFAMMRKKPQPSPLPNRDDTLGADADQDGDSLGFPAPAPAGFADPGIDSPFGSGDPEATLRSIIEMDPDNLQAHLDLLRLLHGQGDAAGFEDAAQAMRARILDPDQSIEWQEARQLGEYLVPDSALFSTPRAYEPLDLPSFDDPPAPAPAPAPASLAKPQDDGLGDLDFGSFDPPAPAPAPAHDLGPDSGAFEFDLDLDGPTRRIEPLRVDTPAPAPALAAAPAPAPADDLSFDFNLDFDGPPAPAPAPVSTVSMAAPAPAPAAFEPPTLDLPDFDFGDIKPVEKVSFTPTERAPQVVPSTTSDLAAPEIIREPELPALDDVLFSSDDAVGTKLDLARAYLDMGDPDGARSMLEEVISEGDDSQRNEARELLTRLG